MKYVCLFLAFLCAIGAGISIANHNYILVTLNVFCVFLNINSYNRLNNLW